MPMESCCLHDLNEKERLEVSKHFWKLQQEGWKEQYTYSEPKLSEIVELFKQMGLEVRVESPTPPEIEDGCAKCGRGQCTEYKTIFTREP